MYLPVGLLRVILNALVDSSLDIKHKDFIVELQVKDVVFASSSLYM